MTHHAHAPHHGGERCRSRSAVVQTLLLLPLVVVLFGCGSIASDWRSAEKENKAEVYQDFVKQYPRSSYAGRARTKLLELRWSKLAATNDLDGLIAFQDDIDEEALSQAPKLRSVKSKQAADSQEASVAKYPKDLRSLTEKVSARRAELTWETLRGSADTPQLEAFLEDFPKAGARPEVERRLDELAWAAAVRQGTLAAWRDYLNRYGDGAHAAEARRLAEGPSWSVLQARSDEASLRQHLALFPQGATTTPAREALADVLWRRAERDQTDLRPYSEYLELHPNGPHAVAAQDAVDWSMAESDGTLAAVERYLRRHPEGRFADHARNALPTLQSGAPPKVQATIKSAISRIKLQVQSSLKRTKARGSVDITGTASVTDRAIAVVWRGGGMRSFSRTAPGKSNKKPDTYKFSCAFTGKVGPRGLTSLACKDSPRANLRVDGVSYADTAEGWMPLIEQHFKKPPVTADVDGSAA